MIIGDDMVIRGGAIVPFAFDDQFGVSNRALDGYNGWFNLNPDVFNIVSNVVINSADAASFIGDASHEMTGLNTTLTWQTDFYITISSIVGQTISRVFLYFQSETVTILLDFITGTYTITTLLDSATGAFTRSIGSENKYSVIYDGVTGLWSVYNNAVLLATLDNGDSDPLDTTVALNYRGNTLPAGRFSLRRVHVAGTSV